MKESTPQLDVIKDDSLSIDDLLILKNQGFSVLRSAHVGNLSPYNLGLAQVGIPILSVDHTITGVDRNYMPESINTQTSSDKVSSLGKLVCRAITKDIPGEFTDYCNGVQYVDQLHITMARKILGAESIFSNTEYLRQNESVVSEVIDLAAKEFPGYFDRLALPDGTTAKERTAASMVDTLGIMQLNDDPRQEKEAVIIPNIVDIMANFVIEALESEQEVQYHLSGPDMVNYIDGLMPDLQKFYGRLTQTASFGKKLPSELVVKLVPTAASKFATTKSRQEKLDGLLKAISDAEIEHTNIRLRRKDFFASKAANDLASKNSFLDDVKRRECSLEVEIAGKLGQIPELLKEPGTGSKGFITQYDVMREGGLYISPANRQMSMAQLAILSGRLDKLGRRYGL